MAYLEHLRQTVRGGLPGGEAWSCSYSFSPGGIIAGNLNGAVQNWTAQCAARWATALANTDLRASNGVTSQSVVTRLVGTDGKTRDQWEAPSNGQGGGGLTPTMPNQNTVVLSLISGQSGARGRGRVYLPILSPQMGTNGRLLSGQPAAFLAVMKTLFEGMNNDLVAIDPGNDLRLIVASGVGAGANHEVLTLRIGDVVDTQRRRRDAIPENYAATVFAP